MAKDIFFSYGHDEYAKYVVKVKEYLEKEDFDVFFDEERLDPSDDWDYKLEQGIANHKKVIFFITKHSARRPDGFCLNELSLALVLKKEIIPVMLEKHIPPLSIIRKQFLDMTFFDPQKDDTDDKLFIEKMERLIKVLNGEKLDSEGRQQKLLSVLDPIDFTQDFERHKRFIGRNWIIDGVNKWIEEEVESKVLWITAEAGYGKSAIAAHLATTHPDVVGIHFCSYNYPSKNDPVNVIKTLAYHFQSQIDGYFDEIVNIDTKNKNVFELYEQLISNPLSRVKNKDKIFIFIIDALDETLEDESKDLISLIGSETFQQGLPAYARIIITSRPDPQLKQTFSRLNPIQMNAELQHNIEDCRVLIETKLKELGHSEYIYQEALIKNLLETSEANMLYLNIFFDEVKKQNINIEERDSFPQGLNGTYESYFQRITKENDTFDGKFAPLLEVLVAYGEPIPKLLLKEILKWETKQFSRVLTKLGSMLKEREEYVSLYHKSIMEWLVNEDNRSYLVNAKTGKKKIDKMLEELSPESYKEEYLKFTYFNKKLVDKFYEEEKKLEKFFALLKDLNDKNKIELLIHLGDYYYYAHHNVILSTRLREEVYMILKKFYKKNREKWAGEYAESLSKLAWSYDDSDQNEKVVILREEALDIFKRLYVEDKETWVEDYISMSSYLAFSYNENRIDDAIELAEENVDIVKELYENNKEKWVGDYAVALSVLSSIYDDIDRIDESIALQEENLKNIREFYCNGKDALVSAYMAVISGLSLSYELEDRIAEAIILKEEEIEVLKDLSQQDGKRWLEKYSKVLKDLTKLNKELNSNEIVLEFGKEKSIAPDTGIKKMTPYISEKKVGRNDPCPCGSGKKYKKCCEKNG